MKKQRYKTALIAAALALTALPPKAQAANFDTVFETGPLAYEHPRFGVSVEKLADDIYLMRRIPSWRTWVQANVTVIVNETDVIVVDGGGPVHVENIVAEIKKITDKPVSAVITTHWHQDHNWGNHIYRAAWPGLQIISHEKTRETLIHRDKALVNRPKVTDEMMAKAKAAGTADARERLEKAKADGLAPAVITLLEDNLAGIDEVTEAYRRIQSGPADITFRDRLVLERGARSIEVLFLGRANTDGDAVIWLPGEKIAIAGDIVVRPTPYGFYSYPLDWADTLDRIKALGFTTLVPGHGPVMHDSAYIDALAVLMRDLTAQAKIAVAEGASSAEEVKAAIDWSAHDQAITGGDPLLSYLFDKWFKTPISVSAFKEAKGEPIPQYEVEK